MSTSQAPQIKNQLHWIQYFWLSRPCHQCMSFTHLKVHNIWHISWKWVQWAQKQGIYSMKAEYCIFNTENKNQLSIIMKMKKKRKNQKEKKTERTNKKEKKTTNNVYIYLGRLQPWEFQLTQNIWHIFFANTTPHAQLQPPSQTVKKGQEGEGCFSPEQPQNVNRKKKWRWVNFCLGGTW